MFLYVQFMNISSIKQQSSLLVETANQELKSCPKIKKVRVVKLKILFLAVFRGHFLKFIQFIQLLHAILSCFALFYFLVFSWFCWLIKKPTIDLKTNQESINQTINKKIPMREHCKFWDICNYWQTLCCATRPCQQSIQNQLMF